MRELEGPLLAGRANLPVPEVAGFNEADEADEEEEDDFDEVGVFAFFDDDEKEEEVDFSLSLMDTAELDRLMPLEGVGEKDRFTDA